MSAAEASFDDFVRPHAPAMQRLAARLVGRSGGPDVVQAALVRAWKRWETFDESRGTPASWLLAIVVDQARRGRRRKSLFVVSDSVRAVATVANAIDAAMVGLEIERALSRLSARQRMATELYYFGGLSLAEVAAVMETSVGTAKSTLFDARGRLRLLLGGNDG